MAKFTEEQLQTAIKTRSFAPVYVLQGEEQYLIHHYANRLADVLVGDVMRDFNLAQLQGENTSLHQILEAAEGLPMMHDHRCILVRDYSPAEESDSVLKEWASYLADPCEGNVIVFYYATVKPAATKNWKAFLSPCETHGGVLTLNKKTRQDLVKILCSGAGKRNCQLSASTATYLIECVGEDLNTLLGELEKLCAYKANLQIEDKDVDLLCTKTLSATAFQMIREINRRNSSGAMQILNNLFRMREDPIKIFGALASSYVNMYRALTADEARLPLTEFGKALGMKNVNGLTYSLKDARALGAKRLDHGLTVLAEYDKKLKSQSVDPKILLEQVVVELLCIAGARYD